MIVVVFRDVGMSDSMLPLVQDVCRAEKGGCKPLDAIDQESISGRTEPVPLELSDHQLSVLALGHPFDGRSAASRRRICTSQAPQPPKQKQAAGPGWAQRRH